MKLLMLFKAANEGLEGLRDGGGDSGGGAVRVEPRVDHPVSHRLSKVDELVPRTHNVN